MSRSTLRRQVREFYLGARIPAEHAERLAGMVRDRTREIRPRSTPAPARSWRAPAALALAASLVVAIAWILQLGAPVEPRFIAVRIHADWCNRTPVVTPVFTRLLEEFGGEDVLFVSFDMTDDARRSQSRQLTATLGIEEILEPPFESGMIKLVDRERGRVVATVTGDEGVSEMETILAAGLGRAPARADG